MDESRFLKGLFEGMRCGMLAVDPDGRLVVLNELGARILEVERAPEPGTPLDAALPGQPRLVRLLRDALESPRLANREELELECQDGPRKTIGYTLSRVRARECQPAGVAMFFRDLTVIERKEEHERLRDRLAALGQMAASMAHEIRNPLASIEVTCGLLRRRLAGEDDARVLVDKITSEVRRLNATISSSLEFVRPVALDLSQTEILPMLEEAIRVAVDRAGTASVRVQTDFLQTLPAMWADRCRLRQVFENLLLNAIEAVGDDGLVRVEASVVEQADPHAEGESAQPLQWVQIRVADSGPGIGEEDADKIFNPFFTTKEQGSGVGLSTAKKIVDSHRGQIEAENDKGGGAVFTVRLPLTHEAPEARDR